MYGSCMLQEGVVALFVLGKIFFIFTRLFCDINFEILLSIFSYDMKLDLLHNSAVFLWL